MESQPTSLEPRPLPARRGLLGLLQAVLCVLLGTGCMRAGVHAPPDAPAARPSGTVVLVHGMYMGPSCWERWVPYLEARGYRTLAPAWPAHDGTAAAPDTVALVDLSERDGRGHVARSGSHGESRTPTRRTSALEA